MEMGLEGGGENFIINQFPVHHAQTIPESGNHSFSLSRKDTW